MNKKLVYCYLRLLENEYNKNVYFLVEAFIERREFLFWLRGKGLLTKEKFNYLLNVNSSEFKFKEIFFSSYGIFESKDAKTLCENKAIQILSEFLSESSEYFRITTHVCENSLKSLTKVENGIEKYGLLKEYRLINKYTVGALK
ncbi:hypothetical protein D3C81_07200 [compost metagenome]